MKIVLNKHSRNRHDRKCGRRRLIQLWTSHQKNIFDKQVHYDVAPTILRRKENAQNRYAPNFARKKRVGRLDQHKRTN